MPVCALLQRMGIFRAEPEKSLANCARSSRLSGFRHVTLRAGFLTWIGGFVRVVGTEPGPRGLLAIALVSRVVSSFKNVAVETAGPSTPFGARSAPNSAQDDSVFVERMTDSGHSGISEQAINIPWAAKAASICLDLRRGEPRLKPRPTSRALEKRRLNRRFPGV